MMPLLVAAAVLSAPSLPAAVVLVAASVAPIPASLGVVVLSALQWRDVLRRSDAPSVIGAVVDLAGELRAGSTLRGALAEGLLGPHLAARARSGQPLTPDPADLEEMGVDASLIASTLQLAVDGGGAVAHMFDRLAAGMIERERVRRERGAAMAPALAQAAIVGGVPVAALAWMLVDGRLLDLVGSGPAGAALVVVGATSIVAGIGWIALMVVRTR